MLDNAQRARLNSIYQTLPAAAGTLYHGTQDHDFFRRIIGGAGFGSNQLFVGQYSMKPLGGTAVYGPGIYLADTLAEAKGYGKYVIEFTVEDTTNFIDMSGSAPKDLLKELGVPKQRVLADGQVYALMQVTKNYYVLRTPYNVSPRAHESYAAVAPTG